MDGLDAFSWHDYQMGGAAPDIDNQKMGQFDHYLERLRILAPSKSLIVDELGLWNESPLGTLNLTGGTVCDWKTAGDRAVKMIVSLRAVGSECILPHIFAGGGGNKLDGFEPSNRGPQPKTSAFLMACYWLNNATPIGHRVIGDKAFFYAWRRSDGSTLVFAWGVEGSKIDFHPIGEWKTTDIFGQAVTTSALGSEPLLIWVAKTTAPELTLDAVAAALGQ